MRGEIGEGVTSRTSGVVPSMAPSLRVDRRSRERSSASRVLVVRGGEYVVMMKEIRKAGWLGNMSSTRRTAAVNAKLSVEVGPSDL